MAGLVDVCSLVLTSAFFIGVILGTALIAQKCQALIDATKASLEERGWLVSRAHPSTSSSEGAGGKGTSVVVVKTGKKRMDHERYLDATQRGVIKALNASTFGAPSSQNQQQSQMMTGNASASAQATAPAPAGPSSGSSSFGGLSSTFAQFRSQLLLPSLAPPPQQDQLEPAISASGGGGASGTGATSADPGPGRGRTRDSLYDMADRLSTWPSEKVEKVKRLRDQFLSKV